MYAIDRDLLWKKYKLDKGKGEFNTGQKAKVLPFKTKKMEKEFKDMVKIFSCLSRELSRFEYEEVLTKNGFINKVVNEVETNKKAELGNIIDKIFFDDQQLNVFHPTIFNYIGVENKGIKDIASFFYTSMFDGELIQYAEDVYSQETNSIIEELVLKGLPDKKQLKRKVDQNSTCLFPKIKELFKEDFKYICSNETLFIESASKLTQYYISFICMQTILKLKQLFRADFNEIEPVYYFVDWEQISKSRTGYQQGWKMIDQKSMDLFAYVNMLEILNSTDDDIVYNFPSIKSELEKMSSEQIGEFESIINDFVKETSQILNMSTANSNSTKPNTFNGSEAIDVLLSMLIAARTTGKKAAYEKFEKTIKDVVHTEFLKPRGPLGSTLNIREEWLLFFTKLAIKDSEKIRLSYLWREFEQRGVYFDMSSKERIVEYFEKINLLEKKSDSGDAQYVRIL